MHGTRNTFFVVSLVLLASLVGHIAIHRHFNRQVRSRLDVGVSNTTSSPLALTFNSAREKSDVDGFRAPRFLSHNRRVVPAVDAQVEKDHEASRQIVHPPAEVPSPTDATAIEDAANDLKNDVDQDETAVRDVIEHELSHATREEREIWYDELKALPAGVVRDLLQVRKQLRALPRVLGGIPEKLASADPLLMHQPHEVLAEPASQRIRFNLPDYLASTAALESAISQLRHNLTNASTPGFKRLRVMLVDAYGSGPDLPGVSDERRPEQSAEVGIQGEGCRNAPALLDLKQGVLKKTSQQFDLAIEGEGFFVVKRDNAQYLTRCGAFALDRERHLCLAISNELAILQPPITIPESAREILFSSDGTVTAACTDGNALTVFGRVQLARVASPTRLQPAGNTLFLANSQSGDIVIESPMANGLGEIQQGFLERSNVEIEKELEEIEELSTILKALPTHNPRPATANGQNHAHKR